MKRHGYNIHDCTMPTSLCSFLGSWPPIEQGLLVINGIVWCWTWNLLPACQARHVSVGMLPPVVPQGVFGIPLLQVAFARSIGQRTVQNGRDTSRTEPTGFAAGLFGARPFHIIL